MTKEIIEKVTQQGNSLDINDLNAEEKKNLAEFLSAKGFTDSTFTFVSSKKVSILGKFWVLITVKVSF